MLRIPHVFCWAHWCLFPSWHHFKNFIVLDMEVFICSHSWRAISASSLWWNWWSSNCCSGKLLLLLIQSCLIYFCRCHAGPISVIVIDVHWPLLNFALFSDIKHCCCAGGGEFKWERRVLTNKTESYYELQCVTDQVSNVISISYQSVPWIAADWLLPRLLQVTSIKLLLRTKQ